MRAHIRVLTDKAEAGDRAAIRELAIFALLFEEAAAYNARASK